MEIEKSREVGIFQEPNEEHIVPQKREIERKF